MSHAIRMLNTRSAPDPARTGRIVLGLDPHTQIAYLTLCYATAFSLSVGASFLLGTRQPNWATLTSFNFLAAVTSVLVAGVGFVLAHWGRLSEARITQIALGWEVLGTLGIVIAERWHIAAVVRDVHAGRMMGVSWACVFLMLFPVLVRAGTAHVFVASLFSAAVGPVFLAVYALATGEPVPWSAIARLGTPLTICAALSVLPALIVGQVRRDMDAARQLGRYRLVARLGHGGMGEVWCAAHQMLIRPAAIKLINPEVLSSSEPSSGGGRTALKRFEREVQATASLQSPHTISVYDFGVTEHGLFYYVMELLTGFDARTLVDRFGPVTAPRAVYLLRQVCHSLDEAHQAGLIHRDIKPANIYVCRHGVDDDFVKVLDFGLVKTMERAALADQTSLTVDGASAGTPAYMAPEVVLAEKHVDDRIDIYACGCLAYWLITGQEVFESQTPMGVVIKHVSEAPDPPSTRTELEIPPDLEAVVMACLEKDPERRPQTARELAARLDRCAVGTRWDVDHAHKWWEVHVPELVTTAGSTRVAPSPMSD